MRLQVTGVLATRETFMVSIYDYNKDAEEAEQTELAAAAGLIENPLASTAVKRNLSGGVTVKSRHCQSAEVQSTHPVMHWAFPAWVLVFVLVAVLAWERRRHLQLLPRPGETNLTGFGRGLFDCSKASVLKQ